MDLDHPDENREKVARHRRFHPQPWHAFLHDSRALQIGEGKLDAEVGGSFLHAVLHPRCRGLWPRRNTAHPMCRKSIWT